MDLLIFFYSKNGAGHENRVAAIAKALEAKGIEIGVVPLGKFFGIADFGNATIIPYDSDNQSIKDIISTYKPSMICTELYPLGYSSVSVFNEILAQSKSIPKIGLTRGIVSASQDAYEQLGIKDALWELDPESAASVEHDIDAYYDNVEKRVTLLNKYFDDFYLMTDDTVFPPEWGFPETQIQYLKQKNPEFLTCLGFASDMQAVGEATVKSPHIVITCGSGSPNKGSVELNFAVIEALQSGKLDGLKHKITLLLGPDFPENERAAIHEAAISIRKDKLEIIDSLESHEVAELISSASAAVIQPGYNTVLLCLQTKTPFISYPNPRDPEQLVNAFGMKQKLEKTGVLIKPDAQNITDALLEISTIHSEEINWPEINTHGAENFASHVVQKLQDIEYQKTQTSFIPTLASRSR